MTGNKVKNTYSMEDNSLIIISLLIVEMKSSQ